MVTIPKNLVQYLAGILLLASLTACGGSSSSSDTTIPNSVEIAYVHNLVFKNNTTLATGYNGFGQLGTGDLKSRNTLGTIKGDYRFKGFAMGGVHSVAFINNSTVMSWGYNGFGQLGNKSTTYSAKPVEVATIRGAKAVAAGLFHSLALRNDGTVWSWGSNDAGQLGIEKKFTASGYSTVPENVGGSAPLTNISSIAAGGKHSLALDAFGKVFAWGYNNRGQIGIDPLTTGDMSAPFGITFPAVDILDNPTVAISGIAAGGSFSYAVAGNGILWAWGNNDSGQLGNMTTDASYRPVQVLKAPGVPLDGVIQVAAGLQHGLALLTNGEVWAWGYNAFSQLGNDSKDSPVAVQVDPTGTIFSGPVTEIRAFGSSSMARVGKDWYVWGDNAFGQLGVGTNSKISLPEKMLGL